MQIRLKKSKDFYFHKNYKDAYGYSYLIRRNYSAGRKDVYDVYILNVNDPITIGRELDLKYVRDLIYDYENEANFLSKKKLDIYSLDIIKLCIKNVAKQRWPKFSFKQGK